MDQYGRQLVNDINYPFMVTEDSPGIDNPKGFKLTLLPYQSKCVAVAMLMENNNKYTNIGGQTLVSNEGIAGMPFSAGKTVWFLALVASQPCPKTKSCNHLVDSMFLKQEMMSSENVGHYVPISTIEYKPKQDKIIKTTIIFVSKTVFWQWIGEIEKFTNFKYLAIENIFDLNAFMQFYNDIEALEQFDIILVKNGSSNAPVEFPPNMNQVLDRYGIRNQQCKKFIDVLSVFFSEYVIARVGYDDADQINNVSKIYPFKSLYTWFLSASPGYMYNQCYFGNYGESLNEQYSYKLNKKLRYNNQGNGNEKVGKGYMEVTDQLTLLKYPFKNPLYRYGITRRYFTINVKKDYLDKYIDIGRPNYFMYELECVGGGLLNGIKTLIPGQAGNIIEAINAGAITHAAGMGGIKADSIAEMLGVLFKKELDIVKRYKKILVFIDYLKKIKDTVQKVDTFKDLMVPNPNQAKAVEEPVVQYTYGVKEIRKGILPIYWRATIDEDNKIYNTTDKTLEEEIKSCGEKIKECNEKINVVKNMFNDICRVCNLELKNNMDTDIDMDMDNLDMMDFEKELYAEYGLDDDDDDDEDGDENLVSDSSGFEDLCILPCCTNTIHAECAMMCCNFRRQTTKRNGVEACGIVGRCPFDRNHIVDFQKLIFLSKNTNFGDLDTKGMEDMVEVENMGEKAEAEKRKKEKSESAEEIIEIEEEYIPKDKIDAAIAIIRKKRIAGTMNVDLYIPNVMEGAKSLKNTFEDDDYKSKNPKVLIFTNYDSSIKQLSDTFEKEGDIRFRVLEGQASHTNKTVEDFNNDECDVLIINSTARCAGLNLQAANDAIFMHKINDINILTQSMGRIQRLGRKYNANVHFILYSHEIEEMKAMMRVTTVADKIKQELKEAEAAANNVVAEEVDVVESDSESE